MGLSHCCLLSFLVWLYLCVAAALSFGRFALYSHLPSQAMQGECNCQVMFHSSVKVRLDRSSISESSVSQLTICIDESCVRVNRSALRVLMFIFLEHVFLFLLGAAISSVYGEVHTVRFQNKWVNHFPCWFVRKNWRWLDVALEKYVAFGSYKLQDMYYDGFPRTSPCFFKVEGPYLQETITLFGAHSSPG